MVHRGRVLNRILLQLEAAMTLLLVVLVSLKIFEREFGVINYVSKMPFILAIGSNFPTSYPCDVHI